MDDTVRDLEARFPGFQVQYSDDGFPFGAAGWYARRGVRSTAGITVGFGPVFYGATLGELSAALQEQV